MSKFALFSPKSPLARPARALAATLLLAGCLDTQDPWWEWPGHGTGGEHSSGSRVKTTPLAALPDVSAEDYADNTHGLITGDTLATWVGNWKAARPAGIRGKLVVLQVVPAGVTTASYVTPNGEAGVYSYAVPASSLLETRDNGLSDFEAEIPAGEAADAFLKRYDIDPRRDFVALTFEQQAATTNAVVQSVGRAWLLLHYWGLANAQIGILNGSVNWNATTHGLPLSTVAARPLDVPPDTGTVSVRDLKVDNTGLVVTLGELVALLSDPKRAKDKQSLRIVDARGGAEALGLLKATSTGRTDCPSYDAAVPQNRRCSTPFEGRIKGAASVPWTQFVDSAQNGFQLLSKAQSKLIFDAQAGYDASASWTIQYCRTNQRSMVTGIVASVVLGYPTRFYETSFIEWGHIAHGPTVSTQVVPADHPLRTDTTSLTEHAELSAEDAAKYVPGLALASGVQPARWVDGPNYNADADISPPSASWPPVDPTSLSATLSVDTDRAYLRE